MTFFRVDAQACKADAFCVAVCPVGILAMDAARNIPVPVEGAAKRCIACGHCVAVCPHAACSLAAMPVGQCPELPADWQLDFSRYATWAKARRSVRTFTQEPIANEQIERLLDVARYAPSGINLQPVRWLVVHDPAKLKELAAGVIDWMRQLTEAKAELAEKLDFGAMIRAWEQGKDRVCRGAPQVLIAAGLKEDITAGGACTIALAHLELAAHAMGLGACWAGYVQMALMQNEFIRKHIGISHRLVAHGALLLGHVRYPYRRIPLRKKAAVVWR